MQTQKICVNRLGGGLHSSRWRASLLICLWLFYAWQHASIKLSHRSDDRKSKGIIKTRQNADKLKRDYLSDVVKWEPREKDVCKELSHTEESIHHPVSQPFCIIIFGGAFYGLDAAEKTYKRQELSYFITCMVALTELVYLFVAFHCKCIPHCKVHRKALNFFKSQECTW